VVVGVILLFSVLVEGSRLVGKLGTKTPYGESQKRQEHACAAGLEEEYEFVHVYMIVRHGTRFPTSKHISKMKEVLRDVPGVRVPFREMDAGLLSPVGHEELFAIGDRVAKLFPALIGDGYHPLLHDFKSSQVTRALQSAESFARGMFGANSTVAIVSETKSLDYTLRFHKACPRYIWQVKKNETLKAKSDVSIAEREIYSAIMKSSILKHKGFSQDEKAKLEASGAEDVVSNVWDLCVMEHAVFGSVSQACHLLSDWDVHQLEYLDDLTSYWFKGYGFPINYEMSCILFSDIAEITKAKAKNEVERKGTFRFAHAETLIPLIARFGLFKDNDGAPFRLNQEEEDDEDGIDLDPEHRSERKWRIGSIVPFAANVAVVLSRSKKDNNLFVQVMHNEHVIRLPASLCPGHETTVTRCEFNRFYDSIKHIVEDCNFQKTCKA